MTNARLLGAIGTLLAATLYAQTPASPRFEAASVKRNPSGDAGGGWNSLQGSVIRATNVTLRFVIAQAYGVVQDGDLVGGPSWIDRDGFDIVATRARATDPAFPMVRTLLAERFKLVIHRETRERPIYELVMLKADGQLGPNIRPSTCFMGPVPPGDTTRTPCGFRIPRGSVTGTGIPIALVASQLGFNLQRHVVDRTGLKGTFDIDLRWLPAGALTGSATGALPPDADAPSIFTAVQEQLGLKLVSTSGPVDVLVIDSAEHPTED